MRKNMYIFDNIPNIDSLLEKYGKSFTEGDIPNNFIVVFDIRSESDISNLQNKYLPGIKGISGNVLIIRDFFTVARNSMLVMNGSETINKNKASKIMYDNPHYLVSNDMEGLFRIFNQNREVSWSKENILNNLYEYMLKYLKSKNIDIYSFTYSSQPIRELSKIFEGRINNLHDFVNIFHNRMAVLKNTNVYKDHHQKYVIDFFCNMSHQKLYNIFEEAFKIVAQIYSSEGEWIIKGDGLIIPDGSKLIVAEEDSILNIVNMDLLYNNRELYKLDIEEKYSSNEIIKNHALFLSNILDRLESIYEISIVSYNKFQSYRNSLFEKPEHEQAEKLKDFFKL